MASEKVCKAYLHSIGNTVKESHSVVRKHLVSIARDFGKEVLIEQGLGRGDLVILNPMVDLAEGSKVAPQPQPASS